MPKQPDPDTQPSDHGKPKTPKKKRKSRAVRSSGLPKGAYRVPPGDSYVLDTKPQPKKAGKPTSADVVVRAVWKAEPDYHALARTLLEIAKQEIDAEWQAKEDAATKSIKRPIDRDAA